MVPEPVTVSEPDSVNERTVFAPLEKRCEAESPTMLNASALEGADSSAAASARAPEMRAKPRGIIDLFMADSLLWLKDGGKAYLPLRLPLYHNAESDILQIKRKN